MTQNVNGAYCWVLRLQMISALFLECLGLFKFSSNFPFSLFLLHPFPFVIFSLFFFFFNSDIQFVNHSHQFRINYPH